MAWTTPRTWVTNEFVTAALMNIHLRDNLLETAPGKATTAGDIFYATAANAIARHGLPAAGSGLLTAASSAPQWRPVEMDIQNTAQILTSTSYTTGAFPSVTLGTGTDVLVIVTTGNVSNDTAGQSCWISVDVSGATTIAAADGRGARFESGAANDGGNIFLILYFGSNGPDAALTAGTNTFQMQGKVSGGQGSFDNNRITVIRLN